MYKIQLLAIQTQYENQDMIDNMKSFENDLQIPLTVSNYPDKRLAVAEAIVDEVTYQRLLNNGIPELKEAMAENDFDLIAFFLVLTIEDIEQSILVDTYFI